MNVIVIKYVINDLAKKGCWKKPQKFTEKKQTWQTFCDQSQESQVWAQKKKNN